MGVRVVDAARRVMEEHRRGLKCLALLMVMLVWVVMWNQTCRSTVFVALFAVLSLVIVLVYHSYDALTARSRDLPFMILLVVLGALFAVLFTPGAVPDEVYHYWSSYGVANLLLGVPIDPESSELVARTVDAELDLNGTIILAYETIMKVMNSFELFTDDLSTTIVTCSENALDYTTNPLYVKLFSALGIALGRVLHLGGYATFYLGRFCNFIPFVVAVGAAVRITPVGKTMFKAVALLPMTLHLAASYSYDAGTIALGFLLTALMLKLIYAQEQPDRAVFIAVPIVTALLAPCKVVYVVIAGAVILVPTSRFRSARNARLYQFGVIAAGCAAIALMRGATLLTMADAVETTSGLDYRGTESGTFYDLSDALAHPIQTIALYLRTMIEMGEFYVNSAIGNSLGWFQQNIVSPDYLTLGFGILLLLATVRDEADGTVLRARHRLVLFGIVAVGWIGIMTSMYLGWTFNTETLIQGVQGRYILPLLPMLLLALRVPSLRWGGRLERRVIIGMAVLGCLNLSRIMALAISSHL